MYFKNMPARMKLTVLLQSIFIIILLTVFFSVSISVSYANQVLFHDDFEDDQIGDFPSKWKYLRSVQWGDISEKCKNGDNDAEWEILNISSNNVAYILIDGPSCVYEIIPESFTLPDPHNYEYEVDIYLGDSDFKPRNIAYKHHNGNNSYSLKILPTQQVELQKSVNALEYPNHHVGFQYVSGFMSNTKYTFKIRVENDLITYYINEIEQYSVQDVNPILDFGTIALQASIADQKPSAVYFDNIYVRSLVPKPGLDVPHFSQRDPDWKDITYDHNDSPPLINFNDPGYREIEEWGCALTSAAMILSYHGFDKTPTGNELNPASLNQFLISNHGYTKYGGVKWNGITKFAKDVKTAGFVDTDHYLLEFSYDDFDYQTVASDIQAENPNIIKIITDDKDTPQHTDDNLHFVVATNIDTADNNAISINDPLDLVKTDILLQNRYTDKEYRQLARFTPSNTDLSYLWINQYNPNIDVLIEHESLLTGQIDQTIYKQIPNADYSESGPISLPDVNPQLVLYPETITEKSFYHQKPDSGIYYIHLVPQAVHQNADLEIFSYDTQGNHAAHQFNQPIGSQPTMLKLNLFPEGDNTPQSTLLTDPVSIGYDYLFMLLDHYHATGDLADDDVYNSLTNKLKVSEKMLGKKDLSRKLLEKPFIKSVDTLYGEGRISQSAYDAIQNYSNLLLTYLP
jgi:hypothetical protein